MATKHLRVFAVDDRRFPLVGADGLQRVDSKGRQLYAGRDRRTHDPLPEGEIVPFHPDYLRAGARGDLIVEPVEE
jgi:hypothetical protein